MVSTVDGAAPWAGGSSMRNRISGSRARLGRLARAASIKSRTTPAMLPRLPARCFSQRYWSSSRYSWVRWRMLYYSIQHNAGAAGRGRSVRRRRFVARRQIEVLALVHDVDLAEDDAARSGLDMPGHVCSQVQVGRKPDHLGAETRGAIDGKATAHVERRVRRGRREVRALHQERQHLGHWRKLVDAVAQLAAGAHQLEQPVAGDVAEVVRLELGV